MNDLHSNAAIEFWKIHKSDRTAFVHPDGAIVTYQALAEDIERFSARFERGPGLVGLMCDGGYRQYVAYLAALNSA